LYRSATYNVQFTRFFASADRSKVEETLKMLKEDLERQQEEDTRIKKEVYFFDHLNNVISLISVKNRTQKAANKRSGHS
jgi:hypothetical protein